MGHSNVDFTFYWEKRGVNGMGNKGKLMVSSGTHVIGWLTIVRHSEEDIREYPSHGLLESRTGTFNITL